MNSPVTNFVSSSSYTSAQTKIPASASAEDLTVDLILNLAEGKDSYLSIIDRFLTFPIANLFETSYKPITNWQGFSYRGVPQSFELTDIPSSVHENEFKISVLTSNLRYLNDQFLIVLSDPRVFAQLLAKRLNISYEAALDKATLIMNKIANIRDVIVETFRQAQAKLQGAIKHLQNMNDSVKAQDAKRNQVVGDAIGALKGSGQ